MSFTGLYYLILCRFFASKSWSDFDRGRSINGVNFGSLNRLYPALPPHYFWSISKVITINFGISWASIWTHGFNYNSICLTFQRFPFRARQRSKVKTFWDGRKNQNNPSQHFLTLPICLALKGKR